MPIFSGVTFSGGGFLIDDGGPKDVIYLAQGGYSNGVARTGTFTIDSTTTSVKIWGCGGGGSSYTLESGNDSLAGATGGGGGASQLNGYTLSVTPGETLSYSIGSYNQNTTITRGATVIFQLNAGSAGNSQGGLMEVKGAH